MARSVVSDKIPFPLICFCYIPLIIHENAESYAKGYIILMGTKITQIFNNVPWNSKHFPVYNAYLHTFDIENYYYYCELRIGKLRMSSKNELVTRLE